MAAVVVDTDVVSFLFKRDTRAEAYKPHLRGKLLTISFMTVAELDRWAIARSWGEARRQQLEEHHPQIHRLPLRQGAVSGVGTGV